MLGLLDKILNNKYKDLYTVRLGTALILTKFGVIGVPAKVVTPLLAGTIGMIMEAGVFQIDLLLDSYREGQKLEEFREKAKEIYEHTVSKIHTEEEKIKIRRQYLDIISRIGSVG